MVECNNINLNRDRPSEGRNIQCGPFKRRKGVSGSDCVVKLRNKGWYIRLRNHSVCEWGEYVVEFPLFPCPAGLPFPGGRAGTRPPHIPILVAPLHRRTGGVGRGKSARTWYLGRGGYFTRGWDVALHAVREVWLRMWARSSAQHCSRLRVPFPLPTHFVIIHIVRW